MLTQPLRLTQRLQAVTPVVLGTILALAALITVRLHPLSQDTGIRQLADGPHQLCQSSGEVCFNFIKMGNSVDGYYGVSQSDDFVCIRGTVSENRIQGQALAASWAGNHWTTLPTTPQPWDTNGTLTLTAAGMVRDRGSVDWIRFGDATLNTEGLSTIPTLPMTPPAQLCHWGV